ncbi:hypothetical protein [Paenibacillus sp. KN14-4R]|uniref:hypothetical protein n=1 Tax=Paenibacillus sp. KN14-4R TaxID=3445773 RepID=UPI003FA0C498
MNKMNQVQELISLSDSMRRAIVTIAQVHASFTQYPLLLGGSAGLLLQGVPLQASPRDLDYYTDLPYTHEISRSLQAYAIDSLCESQTDIYYSLLSHYEMSGVSIELVGGFCVRARNSVYQVDVQLLLDNETSSCVLEGRTIHLMPLSHELLFNLLRRRSDRFEVIASSMIQNLAIHKPMLEQLLARGTWSEEVIADIERLLGLELFYQKRG